MTSLLLLVRLCLLFPGMNAIDVFAAGGETVVLPLYTRLQHTGGQICNKYEWFFMGRYERYQKKLGGVDELCRRQEWENKTRPHCSLSSNGSLQLDGVRAHDAGRYTVTTYHLTRAQNTQDIFILHVLDAISQPVVHLSCLSDHQPQVSCWAVNGTDMSTSITANGELLRENTGAEGEKNLYKLSSSAPWNISCSITNKVSQKTINVLYNMCPVPLSESHLETFCHPDGSANIFCKIENGSEPSFSWSVDGNPVQSTSSWKVLGHMMSGGTSIAVNVSCSVRNAISSVHSPVTTVFCSARAQTFHVLPKILLYFQYNVLMIILIRDIIKCKMNKP